MNKIKFQLTSLKGIEIKRGSNTQHSFKAHLHQELSIGYVENGSTILKINDQKYHIKENEGICIPPFVTHKCEPENIDNWKFIMIYIHQDYLEKLELKFQEDPTQIKKLYESDVEKIKELINILTGEFSAFEKETALLSAIDNILGYFNMDLNYHENIHINKIKEYIKDNFFKEITLDYLQSIFKINKFTLIRGFKKAYNTTPSAYQLQLKIDYSKQCLHHHDNFAEIALEAGFYD